MNGPPAGAPRPIQTRVGLIIPSSNVLTEPQFHTLAPPDVRFHVTRLRMTGANHAPLVRLMPRIEEAGLTLKDARCDLIVFHCTASSTEAGVDGDRLVTGRIEQATGLKATTTASALVAAFRALNVRRLVLVTPYPQATNDHEIAYFCQAGFEVLADRALDLGSENFPFVEPELWIEATQQVSDPRADAYVLSCTNVRAPEVIETLEQRLDRPVIASNPATLWHSLRLLGRDDVIPGLGRLMMAPGVAHLPGVE